MGGKLLIVEDEFLIAQDIRRITSSLGYAIIGVAKRASEALELIKHERPDVALLDINIMGDTNGIELAKTIEKKYDVPYLYITSYSDTATIQHMNKTDPLGYILKPFDERDIRVALEVAFTRLNPVEIESGDEKSTGIKEKRSGTQIIGTSEKIKDALKKVNQVAHTNVTVLIQGETGVGKELIMQAIHEASKRSDKKVVKVNCAALPADLIESILFGHEKGSFTGATEKRIGKFELANGGTIFLDEIGELPMSSQSKLLRCLQEREIEPVGGTVQKKVDVRVIAATNMNLARAVKEGTFRADLFFRLNVFPITVAPLRERKEDILLLANHFLKECMLAFNKANIAFSKKTLKNLETYSWPGNVRELQHFVERGVLLADENEVNMDLSETTITPVDSSSEFQLKSLEDIEREQIAQTLAYCNGKIRGKGGAAEILKLHPNTLDFKIKKLGIVKEKSYK